MRLSWAWASVALLGCLDTVDGGLDGGVPPDAATVADSAAVDAAPIACEAPRWDSAPTPEALRAHCEAFSTGRCRRAFADCTDELYFVYEGYGELDDCLAEAPVDDCDPGRPEWTGAVIDEAVSQACLAALPDTACEDFLGEGGPRACQRLSWPAPPDPAGCLFVQPGRQGVTLATPGGAGWSGNVALLCVCPGWGPQVALRYVRTIDGERLGEPSFQPLAFEDGRPLPGTWRHRYDVDLTDGRVHAVVLGDADLQAGARPTTVELEMSLTP